MQKAHIDTIYNFAAENGFNITDFRTSERNRRKRKYNYVTVSFEVPCKSFDEEIQELEADLEKNNESED